jgi:hypothetical protein
MRYGSLLPYLAVLVIADFFPMPPRLAAQGPAQGPAQGIVISEFVAINNLSLRDEDSEYSDWLELYNPGSTPVNLAGWHLTDDAENLTKWELPDLTLPANGFRIVFASGKDRRDPTGELHANFRLTGAGEFLGLFSPGFEHRSLYTPLFPPQLPDASFGYAMDSASELFVATGATARYFVPTDDSLGTLWREPDFDDSAWLSGPTGLGYDRRTTPIYSDMIRTDVATVMDRVNTSAYIRIEFQVGDPSRAAILLLRMKFDDGFVLFLNGVEAASRNAPSPLTWDARATSSHADTLGVVFENIDISAARDALRPGRNVIAIQGLNQSVSSNDFFILPELQGLDVGEVRLQSPRYFGEPTPGLPNGAGVPTVAPSPQASRAPGAFSAPVTVELSTELADATIRFTTNGSEPSESSTAYTEPVAISTTVVLKAKTFKDGFLPSATLVQNYFLVDSSVANFTSNLPIFVLIPSGAVGSTTLTPGQFLLIDRGEDGRASITGPAFFAGNMGIKTRGSSTEGTPKRSYAFEVRDAAGEDIDVTLLGMPADSDWVFQAAYSFDRAHLRNPLAYDLSNQCGTYATRSRFCEVFVGASTGPLRSAGYSGIYAFMEKIKRGRERVNVEALEPHHQSEPEISGGYMFKIDRLDPGDSGFSAGGQILGFVEPKEREVVGGQRAWITAYINQFVSVLNSANSSDPENGYARFIDVPSWIDHHIINVLTKNVDALRLSTYYYKDRNGKIGAGPVWDFDRSMNSTDGRDDDPRTWNGTGDATTFFTWPWWIQLFRDQAFFRRYRARWRELRTGPLSTANVDATIDRMAAEIEEAQVRDSQRWGQATPAQWRQEIILLKRWLSDRSTWIDGQLIDPPTFSQEGGPVSEGFQLELSSLEGTIYYTLDGSDPRATSGVVAPTAMVYRDPITIVRNTRVTARTRVASGLWSDVAAATFVVSVPPLVITELSYRPAEPSPEENPDGTLRSTHFEFIELLNIGDAPLDLTPIQFIRGVLFDFVTESSVQTLGPGEYVVLVQDLPAFSRRYDTASIRIAGEFRGSFTDRTEVVGLVGEIEIPILTFAYQNTWYPETDGMGHSLVIRDPHAPASSWGLAESWRPSTEIHGSPGRAEPGETPSGRQLPGDLNQDHRLNATDAVLVLQHLFSGRSGLPCEGATVRDGGNLVLADSDGDGDVTLADGVYVLLYLFRAGPAPSLGVECVPVLGCPDACGG